MGLTEDISGYHGDSLTLDNDTKIQAYETDIFWRVCLDLEIYYTLYLCCPQNLFNADAHKVCIIDSAHSPEYALNSLKYLLKTANHILILLVDDKQSKSDHKFDTKVQLETLIDNNQNQCMLVSQVDDKNWIDTFEENTKMLCGTNGLESVIDFTKASKLVTSDLDFYDYPKIIMENMDFNSSIV